MSIYQPTLRPTVRKRFDAKRLREPHRACFRRIERRGFLRGAVGLGAVTLLTGCDITNDASLQSVLRAISRLERQIQAWLFRIRTGWRPLIPTPMSRTRRATTPSIPRSR